MSPVGGARPCAEARLSSTILVCSAAMSCRFEPSLLEMSCESSPRLEARCTDVGAALSVGLVTAVTADSPAATLSSSGRQPLSMSEALAERTRSSRSAARITSSAPGPSVASAVSTVAPRS